MIPRGSRLPRKYATMILALVGGALVISSAIGAYFSYQEMRAGLLALGREKAESAAGRIDQFVREIERQIGWTTLPHASSGVDALEMRRLDFVKLLRQVPAITEVVEIDPAGREQMRLSRLEMDALGPGANRATDPRFLGVRGGETYFGPVYFRKETEPYMAIAVPSGRGGAIAVEVNLKFIWDVISQIRIGQSGYAYVVGPKGKLVAHPDISLVLQQTDMSPLPQVRAVLEPQAAGGPGQAEEARDHAGRPMLTAHAALGRMGWSIFVEQPRREALAPLYASLMRSGIVLLGALALALLASLVLVRSMTEPIRKLTEGAGRIGSGTLDQRIEVHSGDELEMLAEQFNDMARNLRESYASLERKVDERTAQLAREQAKSRELLTNILPESVIGELAEKGSVQPSRHEEATVLFADLVNFTQASATMPARRMVGELSEIFASFDEITYQEGVEKIKTIGDAYMAAAGLSDEMPDHAQRCARAALRMTRYLDERNLSSAFKWQVRIGIHSGPLVSGVVGKRKYAFDIWGDTVNIASRVQSASEAGRVNASAYTYDLIQADFDCTYRGKLTAKGKGDIDMYFVDGPKNAG